MPEREKTLPAGGPSTHDGKDAISHVSPGAALEPRLKLPQQPPDIIQLPPRPLHLRTALSQLLLDGLRALPLRFFRHPHVAAVHAVALVGPPQRVPPMRIRLPRRTRQRR